MSGIVPGRFVSQFRISRPKLSLSYSYSTHSTSPSFSPANNHDVKPEGESEYDAEEQRQRKRKTEWKRRQGGQSFLDHLIINVRGGKGGNGCVAFHREKFVPMGPPSGGNGGRGGDIYILPTPHLTTLSSIPKRVRASSGANGQGTWQNGKNAPPIILKVPLGTVVRELPRDDPRRTKDEWEAEEESLEGLGMEERRRKMRERRWVHYPRAQDDNVKRDVFQQAEAALWREERERRWVRRQKALKPVFLDLDKVEDTTPPVDAPLGTGKHEFMGHLVVSGGAGGMGNPHFLSQVNRSPKFATRGLEGERLTLYLELKILADVGLVGMPNAGKSTLLRALTGGRAKTEVASYAFTTLNPIVGVIRVAEDGTFEGGLQGGGVYEETLIEEEKEREASENAAQTFTDVSPLQEGAAGSEDAGIHDEGYRPGHHFDIVETFRFTIADNPGLISRASENVGLGHSFLRSMERSLALVYVVDLSLDAPWDELRDLREELEKYQPGMSSKARMVIANKADLLGGDGGDEEAVRNAREKLTRLEEYVKKEMVVPDTRLQDSEVARGRTLDVVPVSAKYSQNLRKVVGMMQQYIKEARNAS